MRELRLDRGALPRRAAFLLGLTLLASALPSSPARGAIRHLLLDDNIHRVTAEFLAQGIDEANREKDALVIIQLKTPGGLGAAMETIVQKILGSEVPVAVYVAPSGASAASAGFFITLAADLAIMAPGTNIGAAHPVLPGQQQVDEIMAGKLVSNSAALIRAIAQQRGRNLEMAEKAVTESQSYTDQEALRLGLIDYVCRDLEDVLATLEGAEVERPPDRRIVLHLAGQPLIRVEMGPRQRLLSLIANPNITFILLGLGLLGLYVEFTHPGLIVPGVVGLICLALALFAFSILPVNYTGLALIVLGIILFVAEVKVTSYGLLTLGGVASLLVGSMMLIEGPIPAMRVGLGVVLPVVLAISGVVVFLLRLVVASHRRQVRTGAAGMVGEVGVVRLDLSPRGKVAVHGEIWNALGEEPLAAGMEVEVVSVEGLLLRVRRRQPA